MKEERAALESLGEILEAPPERRGAELAALEARSAELASRVRELLRACTQNNEDGFLEHPVIDAGAAVEEALNEEGPGGREGDVPAERFGANIPLKRLGAGESCTVYLCERSTVDRGRVAVKALHSAADQEETRRRFDAEREAVSVMRHRNIAKFHESGVSSLGRLYFAMEYVDGMTLTRFCEREKPGIRDRLGLFLQVCEGVSHSHQQGIIHRDLKPSNILVESHTDQPPVVKVIDFGIAKARERRQGEGHTRAGLVVGTLAYMSPEQLGGGAAGVSTRSDVFSLGLVLFEVLTGARVFDDRAGLRGLAAFQERHPLEEVLGPHEKLIGRDLCSVLRRATAANPEDRYESVRALADDLERYQRHLPLRARRGSWLYVGTRFARRHRAGIAVAAAVVLGAGMAVGSWWRAREERATLAVRVADAWLNESLGMGRVLGDASKREPLMRRLLAETQRLAELSPRDERIRGMLCAVHTELGYVLLARPAPGEALQHFETVLGMRESLVAEQAEDTDRRREYSLALVRVGDAAIKGGDIERGVDLYGRALAIDESLVEQHPLDAGALSNLGWSYERVAGRSSDIAYKERMLTAQVVAFERLASVRPGREASRGMSSAYKQMAVVRQTTGREFLREAEAAVHYAKLALEEAPLDRLGLFNQARAEVTWAEALPDPAQRMSAMRDVVRRVQRMAADNPDDLDAVELWAYGLWRARDLALRDGSDAERRAMAEDFERQLQDANRRLVR